MDGLSQDWRNGWRLRRSSPTTTAVILGVMMLATGATTASFSVVDAVVLRGLPFYQSDRLVSLDRMGSGKAVISSFAAPDYLAIRAQQDVFEGLAAIADGTLVLRRAEGGDSEVIRSQRVSAEFFEVLRAQPRLGRVFTRDNEGEGHDRFGVISDGYGSGGLAPEVRIVSDRRIEADRKRYGGQVKGWSPGGRGAYVLTGVAVCAECGGGIQVQTRSHRGQRARFYVCARSYNSGEAVCSNRIAVRIETVDDAVLSLIERVVLTLTDDLCETAVSEAVRPLSQRKATTQEPSQRGRGASTGNRETGRSTGGRRQRDDWGGNPKA